MSDNQPVDATALAAFRENPEAYRLRHIVGLTPSERNAKMLAGSALHVAHDLWFSQATSDLRLPLAGLKVAMNVNGGDELPTFVGTGVRALPQMEAVLQAYAARYPREQDPFTVVHTEQFLAAKMAGVGYAFDYCGIVDRLIAFPDGTQYVMDLKSTGSYLNPGYFTPYVIEPQMVGYVALARANGLRCDGFYIDAVHINDKTQVIKAPTDFFRFGPVTVEPWKVERWACDVAWTLGEIERLKAERGLDKPWPVYHNWRYGKPDAYWDFYVYPEELHKDLRTTYVEQPWRPEEVAKERETTRLLARMNQ